MMWKKYMGRASCRAHPNFDGTGWADNRSENRKKIDPTTIPHAFMLAPTHIYEMPVGVTTSAKS